MVQRHSPESKPFGCRVRETQKFFPRFSSQKRLNSLAQETRQVTLRFPLSTTTEADIAVYAATNSDTALTSSVCTNHAWSLAWRHSRAWEITCKCSRMVSSAWRRSAFVVMWAVIHVAMSASEGGWAWSCQRSICSAIRSLPSPATTLPRVSAHAPQPYALRLLHELPEHCCRQSTVDCYWPGLACSTRNRHSQRRSVTLAFQVSGRKGIRSGFPGGLFHTSLPRLHRTAPGCHPGRGKRLCECAHAHRETHRLAHRLGLHGRAGVASLLQR